MFEKVHVYKCSECGRIYEEPPSHCTCVPVYKPGRQIGVFELIRRTPLDRWEVRCGLCGNIKEVARPNLRTQVSCGCKPRHIRIIFVDQENKIVEYECSKCGGYERTEMPPRYCCD